MLQSATSRNSPKLLWISAEIRSERGFRDHSSDPVNPAPTSRLKRPRPNRTRTAQTRPSAPIETRPSTTTPQAAELVHPLWTQVGKWKNGNHTLLPARPGGLNAHYPGIVAWRAEGVRSPGLGRSPGSSRPAATRGLKVHAKCSTRSDHQHAIPIRIEPVPFPDRMFISPQHLLPPSKRAHQHHQ